MSEVQCAYFVLNSICWRVKMHVKRLSSAEPHVARPKRHGSTQSNQSRFEQQIHFVPEHHRARLHIWCPEGVLPHNDLITRHGSNSSPPLIKAAGTRHGTNTKPSSTSNSILLLFPTQNPKPRTSPHKHHVWTIQRRQRRCVRGERAAHRLRLSDRGGEEGGSLPRGQGELAFGHRLQYVVHLPLIITPPLLA
jgi:hypothetical protein